MDKNPLPWYKRLSVVVLLRKNAKETYMASSIAVFYKIATTCLLIFVGFMVRRMKILPENSVSFISNYLVFMALPAYLIYCMPASISPEMLSAYWK